MRCAPSIHIKIDVEGYEASIIEVLQQAPWFKNVGSLVVEIDEENLQRFGYGAATIYDLLDKEGFTPRFGLDAERHYDELFLRQK